MKKAVIYARYSSERQTEQSIEGQLRVCYEFAEHEGIEIIKEYIDRAISGTTDHRPQFQKMIKDCPKLDIDYVIVYKLDRFARNRYDSAIYKAKLKQSGIRLLSAMEKITDSPEGIIMEGLLEAMNEYYSAELSQKIRRGMRENVIKGKTTGGNIALGYRIGADKTLKINEEQAVIVRKIFAMYDSGKTFSEIISTLNESGLKTSRGNSYNTSGISRILSNERYVGRYTIKGIDEVSECPRIIEDDVFQRVQERLQTARAKSRHVNTHTYLLTGVLHCGDCGSRMTGTGGTSKTGRHYYYYHCPKKHHGRINADELETLILRTIDEYLSADRAETIARIAYDEYRKQMHDDSEIKALSKEIKSIETKLSNAVNAVLSGISSETIKNTIENLESQKTAVLTRIDELKHSAPDLTYEMFLTAVNNIVETPSASLINSTIRRIDYYDDRIVVYFRLFDFDGNPPEKIEIEHNVASPPPNATLYANGCILVVMPLTLV